MVSIIDDHKLKHEIIESKTEVYCDHCNTDTYYYVMINDRHVCPSCAVEYFIEPYCACGNELTDTVELVSGVCNECR